MGWFDRSQRAKSLLTCLGATLAYWAVILIGPFVIHLVDFFVTLLSPSGWNQNGIYEQLLAPLIAQALACYLAYRCANLICKKNHPFCVLTNCIVGACACGVFAFFATSTKSLISLIVSAVACIATAVVQAKSISQKATSDESSIKEST